MRRNRLVAMFVCGTLGVPLLLSGCAMSPFEARLENQWSARAQTWLSEASQVKLRAAQSRVFDTTDRTRMLECIITTMQDLSFMVEVLDEEIGVISGSRSLGEPAQTSSLSFLPLGAYYQSQGSELLVFGRNIRTWDPFWYRNNLVRLTVTVRTRNQSQLVVRANCQFCLRALEDPEIYSKFFLALQTALFLEGKTLASAEETGPSGGPSDDKGQLTGRAARGRMPGLAFTLYRKETDHVSENQ